MNQCDGCRRGLPLVGGLHRDPDNRMDMIGCTADRYADAEQALGALRDAAQAVCDVFLATAGQPRELTALRAALGRVDAVAPRTDASRAAAAVDPVSAANGVSVHPSSCSDTSDTARASTPREDADHG